MTLKSRMYPQDPIVIIDDEEAILLSLDTTLQMAGLSNVITCYDSRQALGIMEQLTPSIVLLDLNMPHIDGEALLEEITKHFPQVIVIIITGRIEVESAVRCMKRGAFDYLVKPIDNDRLLTTVQKTLHYSELYRENIELKKSLQDTGFKHPEHFKSIITQNNKMISLFNYIESISSTSQPVLIRGETGTGKELMARAIHNLSGRSGEFVPVNVAGLDDNVFADSLFGHVRGAYTGADSHRSGLIEKAADGTLFLDEIGDLTHSSQVKLLRLLQEQEYMPLGQDKIKTSSARVVASTHVDLWAMQQQNKFRKDLLYRLRTHSIIVPPLRERLGDLHILVDHFLEKGAESLAKPKPTVPLELLPLLETYHFPGNIRELQAMIFDAIAQHKSGVLSMDAFRTHMAGARQAESIQQREGQQAMVPLVFADPLPSIKQATRMLIDEAMRRSGNNQSIAASMLGITQQALSKRLKSMQEPHIKR